MARGKVKWFNAKKGYGFIEDTSQQTDVFVHHTAIVGDGFRSLQEGDRVEYEPYVDAKGLRAKNVKKA